MKQLDEELLRLLISYCIAIGLFNLIFTALITLIVSCGIFNFPFTWKMFLENYAVGYIVLWLLNLSILNNKERK